MTHVNMVLTRNSYKKINSQHFQLEEEENIKGQRFDIEGDGNCLFRAVSLYLYRHQNCHMKIRSESVDYVRKNWNSFKNFIFVENEDLKDCDKY